MSVSAAALADDTAPVLATPADPRVDPRVDPRAAARDTRRQAILTIARDTFMDQGYAAASMSGIAARLGGSKGTLYNYFSSKDELFAAVVANECDAEFCAMTEFAPCESLERSLLRFGGRFLRFALSDTALSFHRLISAEAGRFPELGRLFYEAGPERTHRRLADFLQAGMERGELRLSDPSNAASLLLGLLKANLHQRRVWNVLPPVREADLDGHVREVVAVFLHGYAAAD